MAKIEVLILFALALFIGSSTAQLCGAQAGNALCHSGLCCGQSGVCGSTEAFCGQGCQSQCHHPPPPPSIPVDFGVGSIITEALFNQMLPHRNDSRCLTNGFYIHFAFLEATRRYRAFGNTGDLNTRKRELAAFFGQTSHETTGGWAAAPGGPYSWGYCFITERGDRGTYCSSTAWPCPPGRQYYGRGPIQLKHNYNYGLSGRALSLDLINNPGQVSGDPIASFATALWFWMTPQGNKPSSHDVIIGEWTPSAADIAAGRLPGYGVITNIINGGSECGIGQDNRVANRIGFYKRYCDMLGVSYGSNLDCYNQRPF